MKKQPNIDTAWKIIFEDFKILNEVDKFGYFDVTSPELNPYFESRLLCKIDFREKLPTVFKKNNLSILALDNGVYRIAETDPFFDLDSKKIDRIPVEEATLPSWITTIDPDNISGESQALDAAAASGILNEFIGETSVLTVRGRRRCNSFLLELSSSNSKHPIIKYPIKGVQIEIDGGYEGERKLVLIEAKATASKTMNLRQLIYPQLHFEASSDKLVQTIILFYSKKTRIFNFIPVNFHGAKIILDYTKVRKFRLKLVQKLSTEELKIKSLLSPSKQLTDPSAPFPQANDLDKVLDAYDVLLAKNSLSKSEVFEDLPVSVVGRQYDYYINVLRWMKLVKVNMGIVTLTSLGQKIGTLTEKGKLHALRGIFLSDPLVKEMLTKSPSNFTKDLTEMYRISKTTPERRQSTIKKWDKELIERLSNLT